MRTSIIKLGTLCLFLLPGLPGRPNGPIPDAEPAGARNRHYRQAYLEMAAMLDGQAPLSIKRAVFLAEWAYLDGALNYDEYCYGIDTAVGFLQRFIKVNGLYAY